MSNKYAYIRVSSKDQNIDRQVDAMEKIGISRKQMYIDKQSGMDFQRKNYQRLIKNLKAGDELYVKSIDRLGRNFDDIIEQWTYLTKVKDINIIVLDFPLLDTRNQIDGVTGKFIADIVLQLLSYIAQIERENIHQRQAEGIKLAKQKGIHLGRPRLPIPEDFYSLYLLCKQHKISKREGARRLNTNPTTFNNWIKRYEAQNIE